MFGEWVSICCCAQLYLIFPFPAFHAINTFVWEFCKTSIFTQFSNKKAKSCVQIKFMDVVLSWYMFIISSTIRTVYQVTKGFLLIYTVFRTLGIFHVSVSQNNYISVLVNLKIWTSFRSYIHVYILKVTKLYTGSRWRCISCLNTWLCSFSLTSKSWKVIRKYKYTWGRPVPGKKPF